MNDTAARVLYTSTDHNPTKPLKVTYCPDKPVTFHEWSGDPSFDDHGKLISDAPNELRTYLEFLFRNNIVVTHIEIATVFARSVNRSFSQITVVFDKSASSDPAIKQAIRRFYILTGTEVVPPEQIKTQQGMLSPVSPTYLEDIAWLAGSDRDEQEKLKQAVDQTTYTAA